MTVPTIQLTELKKYMAWLLNNEINFKKIILLTKLYPHATPLKVISIKGYILQHTSLPGLKASTEVNL
jgi:hypothetical protein